MKKIIVLLIFLNVSCVFSQDSNNIIIQREINDLRISKGLDTIVYDENLFHFAKKWSKHIMSKLNRYTDSQIDVNHTKNNMFLHIDGDSRLDIALKKDEIMSIGENLNLAVDVPYPIRVAESSFKRWKHSKSHYELMLEGIKPHFAFYYVYDVKRKRILSILVMSELSK